MLSTIDQLSGNAAAAWGALFISIFVMGYSLYVDYRLRRSNPSKSLTNKLRAEVSSLSGDFADLQDRFTRFQKREGMRSARETKKTGNDLLTEAQEIVNAQASLPLPTGTTMTKAELRAALRRPH